MSGVIVRMVNGHTYKVSVPGESFMDALSRAKKVAEQIINGTPVFQLMLDEERSVFIAPAHIVSIEPY